MTNTQEFVDLRPMTDNDRAYFKGYSKHALKGDAPCEGVIIVDGEKVEAHIPDSEGDIRTFAFSFASPDAARFVGARMVDAPSITGWLEEVSE